MVDLNSLRGAFGSVVSDAGKTAAGSAAARTLGAFGIDPNLQPYAPAPTQSPPVVGHAANIAKEDQQKPASLTSRAMAFVKQYQRVLLIGGGIVLVVGLVLRRKRRK